MSAPVVNTVSAGKSDYPRVGFWSLIVTQFQGAFNDNLFKFIIIFYLLNMLRGAGTESTEAMRIYGYVLEGSFLGVHLKITAGDFVPSFATLLFSLPFILFPAFFGALADRYSKGSIARWVKYIEVVIGVLVGVALYRHNIAFLWVMLFLMATHSTMFSPAKYGLLPEILPESRISWGNGILQMGTIVAIIAGTALAGTLYDQYKDQVYKVAYVLIGLSAFGLLTSQFISKPAPANASQRLSPNPWAGMGRYLGAQSSRTKFSCTLLSATSISGSRARLSSRTSSSMPMKCCGWVKRRMDTCRRPWPSASARVRWPRDTSPGARSNRALSLLALSA